MDKWRIYIWYKSGMALVTFQVACAYSFDNAEKVADRLPIIRNKKRGVLFKRAGNGRRFYDRGGHRYYYWGSHKNKVEWTPPGREYKPPPKPPDPEPVAIPLPPPPTPQQKPMWSEEQWIERQAKRRL